LFDTCRFLELHNSGRKFNFQSQPQSHIPGYEAAVESLFHCNISQYVCHQLSFFETFK